MVPSLEQIAASRQLFAAIARLAGFVLAGIACYQWAYEIEATLNAVFLFPAPGGGSSPHSPSTAWRIWDAMSWSSLVLFVPGVVLIIAPRWFARLLVRLPKHPCCPACNYRLEGISRPRCPECGLELTGAFLSARQNASDREP